MHVPETHSNIKQQDVHILNYVNIKHVMTVITLTHNIRIIHLMRRERKLREMKNKLYLYKPKYIMESNDNSLI